MKPIQLLAALWIAIPLALGQVASTTVLIPAPAGQHNSATAALTLTGGITDPGQPPLAQPLLAPAGPSATLAWVNFQPYSTAAPSTFALTGTASGGANLPLLLAFCLVPNTSFICGGFAGAPCATGPYFPVMSQTGSGLLHLDPAQSLVVFDGIASTPGSLPAFTDAAGNFPFFGTLPVGQATPYYPCHLALQALLPDPTSVTGFRLTAALSVALWVEYP